MSLPHVSRLTSQTRWKTVEGSKEASDNIWRLLFSIFYKMIVATWKRRLTG